MIDEEQSFISWMGFSFNFSFSQVNGIALYDIRLDGERIFYELSLQEALAYYAGNDPVQSSTAFFDSLFGLSTMMSELVPGYDCPSYAKFFDTQHFRGEKAHHRSRTACVFEAPLEYPLQRHRRGATITSYMNSMLIFRTIATVGNYDYLIDYTFYLDGTVEVKVRASGYIQGAYWNNGSNSKYGYRVHDFLSSLIHDHVLNFKADLDIGGRSNNMTLMSVVSKEVDFPWSAIEPRRTMQLEHSQILTEDSASINWPANSATMHIVTGGMNDLGERRGYRIMPGSGVGSPIHLTTSDPTSLTKSAEWTKYDFFVTKQKDTEPRSTSPLNGLTPDEPLIRFDRFLNNESLVDEDLYVFTTRLGGCSWRLTRSRVIWFNTGNHHVPHSGDIPNMLMTTSASSVMFAPHNYHRSDRSRALTGGVRVDFEEGGPSRVVRFGNRSASVEMSGLKGGDQVQRKFPAGDAGSAV